MSAITTSWEPPVESTSECVPSPSPILEIRILSEPCPEPQLRHRFIFPVFQQNARQEASRSPRNHSEEEEEAGRKQGTQSQGGPKVQDH